MRSNSPPPSWYEPPDLVDIDHDDVAEPEVLTIVAGVVSWCSILDHDDD